MGPSVWLRCLLLKLFSVSECASSVPEGVAVSSRKICALLRKLSDDCAQLRLCGVSGGGKEVLVHSQLCTKFVDCIYEVSGEMAAMVGKCSTKHPPSFPGMVSCDIVCGVGGALVCGLMKVEHIESSNSVNVDVYGDKISG